MKTGRKTKAQLVKELEALRKINTTIGTLFDLQAVLQRIIDEIVPLFAAQAASVILFDYATQEAEITTAYGTPSVDGKPLRYQWHGSLAGWVAEQKRPLRLSRLLPDEWPTSAKLAEELGGSLDHISVLLAPLWLNDTVLGCLEVVWDQQRAIANGEEQLLETIATQVAIAIANAQFYTERQRAEAARHQREQLFMKGPVVVFRWRAEEDWPVEYVSVNISQFGYDAGEILRGMLPYKSLIHPEDRERVAAEVRAYAANGATSFEQDYRILDASGHTRWVYDFTVIGCNEHGAITHYDGYLLDITERKNTEAALRSAKEYAETLIKSSIDMIVAVNGERRITEFNSAAEKVFGYQRAEVIGQPVDMLYDDATAGPDINRQIMTTGRYSGEVRNKRKNGERFEIYLEASLVRDVEGNVVGVMGISRDMTDRKQAEDALRESEERHRIVSQCMSDYAFSLRIEDEEHAFMEWLTDNFTRLTGYPVADFLGKSNPWVRYIHPDDLARANATVHQAQPGIPTTDEFRILRKDGEMRWIRSYTYPVRGENGLVTRLYGAVQDITERKHAEDGLRQLQTQLLQTQKLEAIGTLAGGIAHDFNNMLAAVMGYTELAIDDVPSESLTRRNLEEVLSASRRARGLIQQLLTFSRPSHQDRRPLQLHEVVENTLTLLRASLPKNIHIHFAVPQSSDTILADPTQIEQVVMNLCVNAAYAIGDHKGIIGINIDSLEGEHVTQLVSPPLSMPAAYCLTISDTGQGIAPEILMHIFEPFFTTKPVGQGSGMGLAIVHSIMTSHGGSIAVESSPGQGTTFHLYFPPFQETEKSRESIAPPHLITVGRH